MKTNKDWFDYYDQFTLEHLKQLRGSIKAGVEDNVVQLKMLDLVIVTKERNANYDHMFVDDAAKKKRKKETKGAYVKAEKERVSK